MERLTDKIRNFDGTASSPKSLVIEDMQKGMPSAYCSSIVTKLADYEDAEEQGLLLRLKLKVGDEFWELNDNFVEPVIYPRKAHSLQHVLYCMDNLGKTTFLTYEEAELELANRQQSHAESLMDERNGR